MLSQSFCNQISWNEVHGRDEIRIPGEMGIRGPNFPAKTVEYKTTSLLKNKTDDEESIKIRSKQRDRTIKMCTRTHVHGKDKNKQPFCGVPRAIVETLPFRASLGGQMNHYTSCYCTRHQQDGWRGHYMNISGGALGHGKINMADFAGRICI